MICKSLIFLSHCVSPFQTSVAILSLNPSRKNEIKSYSKFEYVWFCNNKLQRLIFAKNFSRICDIFCPIPPRAGLYYLKWPCQGQRGAIYWTEAAPLSKYTNKQIHKYKNTHENTKNTIMQIHT